jgi:hypothetical protein
VLGVVHADVPLSATDVPLRASCAGAAAHAQISIAIRSANATLSTQSSPRRGAAGALRR